MTKAKTFETTDDNTTCDHCGARGGKHGLLDYDNGFGAAGYCLSCLLGAAAAVIRESGGLIPRADAGARARYTEIADAFKAGGVDGRPEPPPLDKGGGSPSARLVYCRRCCKTHAVTLTEPECAVGAWLDIEAPPAVAADLTAALRAGATITIHGGGGGGGSWARPVKLCVVCKHVHQTGHAGEVVCGGDSGHCMCEASE
jgi:hypothetical protein